MPIKSGQLIGADRRCASADRRDSGPKRRQSTGTHQRLRHRQHVGTREQFIAGITSGRQAVGGDVQVKSVRNGVASRSRPPTRWRRRSRRARNSRSAPVTAPPSRITATCGDGPPSGGMQSCSASPRLPYTILADPAASTVRGCWWCGSHFSQSHSASAAGPTTATILQVFGTVQHRKLTDDGTEQCPGEGNVAADGDDGELPERHSDRDIRDHRPVPNQPPQGHRRHRIQLVDRAELGRHQPGGQPLRAESHSHMTEIGIVGSALPHPPAADQRPQRSRLGMTPVQGQMLSVCGLRMPLDRGRRYTAGSRAGPR